MQRKNAYLLLLWVALGTACRQPPPERAVILPPDQAKAMLEQCSRSTPENVDGTWVVPPSVAAQLEQDLGKLSGFKSHHCCMSSKTMSNPEAYGTQLVGITIAGRKYVYINAIPFTMLTNDPRYRELWPRQPMQFCDGGSAFWGALYDPETRQFSELAFNGTA